MKIRLTVFTGFYSVFMVPTPQVPTHQKQCKNKRFYLTAVGAKTNTAEGPLTGTAASILSHVVVVVIIVVIVGMLNLWRREDL